MTLQSLRLLQRADVIYTPVAVAPSGKRSSKAKEIMLSLGITEEQIALYDLPMSKQRDGAEAAYLGVAEAIRARLEASPNRDETIAVVAEGDSGFYSSSAYISDHLVGWGIPFVQLPGVPAFIACNALLGGQLVQLTEQLRVIPGEATDDEWQEAWQSPHTIVVMKGSLCEARIKTAIEAYPERRWHYFEFVGQEREYITSSVSDILERTFPYFSIVVSKCR